MSCRLLRLPMDVSCRVALCHDTAVGNVARGKYAERAALFHLFTGIHFLTFSFAYLFTYFYIYIYLVA